MASSENKGADLLRGYREADNAFIIVAFAICRLSGVITFTLMTRPTLYYELCLTNTHVCNLVWTNLKLKIRFPCHFSRTISLHVMKDLQVLRGQQEYANYR